jgi:hypothetical protein
MSVWGNIPRYIFGAKRQIELAKKYYPDWTIRIYVDDMDKTKEFNDCETILVDDGTSGYFWRFRSLFENENNIVQIRDCDSRITIREKMAVQEWLQSDKSFHTFKDHDAHYEFPVMAGCFGFKGKLSNSLHDIMQQFEKNTFFYTNDQVYLRDHVWQVVQENCLIHSIKDVGWFSDTRKKLKNRFSFCGNGYDERDMPLYPESLAAFSGWDASLCSQEFKFDEGELLD